MDFVPGNGGLMIDNLICQSCGTIWTVDNDEENSNANYLMEGGEITKCTGCAHNEMGYHFEGQISDDENPPLVTDGMNWDELFLN